VRILFPLLLACVFVSCNKREEPAPLTTSSAAPQETGLERIPEADSSKFPRIQEMSSWKNPQLVVREDGIGMVDLENHEIHILTQEQVPAELVSLPESAWPYGRVVLLTEAMPANPSEQTKSKLRENRGLLIGTLKQLQVQIKEAP
jgi:hypothetical protein